MADENGDGRVTKRVVLKREQVLILPDNFGPDDLKNADEKELRKLIGTRIVSAWVVVDEQDGASKEKAIEGYAGKPGTPDARPGIYKAPTTSAWSGGVIYEAPPAPLVQRRPLEDALT